MRVLVACEYSGPPTTYSPRASESPVKNYTSLLLQANNNPAPPVFGAIDTTMKRSARTLAALTLAALALAGCSDTTSQAAFSAYYRATATDQRAYVTADPALSAEQKARRLSAIDAAGAFLDRTAQAPTLATPTR